MLTEIQPLIGSTIVIKYGGASMTSDYLKTKVIRNIVFLYNIGIKVVVVHGGGPIINHWLKRLNIEPKFFKGKRVTDLETLEVVEMVLSGKVNKEIVSLINCNIPRAVGLSGKDANLSVASPSSELKQSYVGYVRSINIDLLNLLLNKGYIPVISSVSCDKLGQTYNVNADSVSASIASALKAIKLILLTDKPGIMTNIDDISTCINSLSVKDINLLKHNGIINGGMIPKVDACIDALYGNVKCTHIIDGTIDDSLLLEIFRVRSCGTTISI